MDVEATWVHFVNSKPFLVLPSFMALITTFLLPSRLSLRSPRGVSAAALQPAAGPATRQTGGGVGGVRGRLGGPSLTARDAGAGQAARLPRGQRPGRQCPRPKPRRPRRATGDRRGGRGCRRGGGRQQPGHPQQNAAARPRSPPSQPEADLDHEGHELQRGRGDEKLPLPHAATAATQVEWILRAPQFEGPCFNSYFLTSSVVFICKLSHLLTTPSV